MSVSFWFGLALPASDPDEAESYPSASVERYRNAAIALLPPGKAISKALDSGVAFLLEALVVEFTRVQDDAETLYRNRIPSAASEYLDEWEEALELPGECVAVPPTTDAERAGAIVAKLIGRTAHSQSAFEVAAETLGYTSLEFERYAPFAVGSSAGDAIYGDDWANFVRVYVDVDEQTADDALVCTFVDQLRRSHGYIDVILEGPMGAVRQQTANYHNAATLAADMVEGDIEPISLRYAGTVSIQCTIDNGAGAAPTDSPIGVWELWASCDGETFFKYDGADATLAAIAAAGNTLVQEIVVLTSVPGSYFKLLYNRTSGGAGDSRATVHVVTW